jgi:hypothetical protein
MVHDPTDLRALERRQAKADEDRARRRQLEREDVAWLMGSPRGRRIVWRLLETCGVYRSSMTGNSETYFREGMRNVGLILLRDIHDATPDEFVLMLKEHRPDDRHDHALDRAAT